MRRTLMGITAAIGLALLLLLAYSVERSSWFLGMYETADAAGWGAGLALTAAIVAEAAALALIIGEGAIGLLDAATAQRLSRWAGFGLLAVLALQAVGGLIAGYTRGAGRMLAELGGGDDRARLAVASVALLLGNLTVPALILALSKIAALLVRAIVALGRDEASQGRRPGRAEPEAPALAPYGYGATAPMPALAYARETAQSTERASVRPEASERSGIGIPGIAAVADRPCPRCARPLDAARYGAARRWGYCAECKSAR